MNNDIPLLDFDGVVVVQMGLLEIHLVLRSSETLQVANQHAIVQKDRYGVRKNDDVLLLCEKINNVLQA